MTVNRKDNKQKNIFNKLISWLQGEGLFYIIAYKQHYWGQIKDPHIKINFVKA